ncbi:outer-membrane lipoprotein carrier protein LolA [Aquabacter sp. L1I39]|nr:outer-membrane lipoprotein carrier protein LolA [Aquabacter sp. L1I39]
MNPASANPPPSVAAAPPPIPVPRPASANEPPVQAAAAPTQIAPAATTTNAVGAKVSASGKPGAPFQPRAVAPVQGDQDRAPDVIIDKVSNYWNGVQVLSGNFVQVDPDGSRKTGDFYMQKPGRVRFEYDSPATLELISNGQSVAVRDRRLNTQDITPLSQTPLRFLLAQTIDLARDPHVVGVYQDNLYVTVVMEEKVPMLGTYKLLLLFDAKDYQLKQWIVTDPQGYDTSVAIRNLDYTRRPDPKLFVINFERMLQ